MHRQKVKIAIATNKMVMGGIERSLIELIKVLQKHNCEITLFLEKLDGELFEQIPENVKIVHIFEGYNSLLGVVKKGLKEKSWKKIYSALLVSMFARISKDPVKGWRATCGYIGLYQEEYDYAFAYGAPISYSLLFIKHCIKAKRKFTWIHNDVDQISLNVKKYISLFREYEKIVCVSNKAKETLDLMCPQLRDKTEVFYNIVNQKELEKKSKEKIVLEDYKELKILTVGRLSFEKGQDIIPIIVKKLIQKGYNVKWFCIGEGPAKKQLEEEIEKQNQEDNVILLGNELNPYPYFNAVDIYVQPSRHEGFGITITEAKMFGLPIIATNFAGANEQLENGRTGYIVDFSIDEIYKKLVVLLEDGDIREKFTENLKKDSKRCVSSIECLFK